MTEQDEEFILTCIEKKVDDSLSDEDAKQLEKLIISNPEACSFYNDITTHHAALKDLGPIAQTHNIDSEKKNALIIFYKVSLVAAALFIVFLGVSLVRLKNIAQPLAIASITKTENCKWLNSSLPTNIGTALSTGKLSLETGLATIKFSSGAEVVLEAPASIELINNMHCRIIDGTVLANVPESAHGFIIDTPTATAIDHGTEFLISYNSVSGQSLVEVLKGEVEVKPADVEKSRRLYTGESALVNKMNIEEAKPVEGMPGKNEIVSPDSTLISTKDGMGEDAYVLQAPIRGHDSNILVMVKKSETTTAKRKGYLKFDLTGLPTDFKSAALHLAVQSSGFGFASLVPDSTFTVFGLKDNNLDSWNRKQLNWKNAPANTDDNDVDYTMLARLGTFEVKRGVYSGIVTLESKELTNFLKQDLNKMATLIIIRNTGEFSSHGLVHAFASKRHPTAMPPTLEFKK